MLAVTEGLFYDINVQGVCSQSEIQVIYIQSVQKFRKLNEDKYIAQLLSEVIYFYF